MKPEVVTIGLGYIGLPTSALIASNGTKVLGVDINKSVVDTINQGKIHIVEPDLDSYVKKAVDNKLFKAATKPETANTYLIVVPTPFKGNNEPDISYVEAATKSVIPLLKEGDLFIIESTSPIGTTEKMQKLIYSNRPELEGKLFIAYCPERVLPGNVMYELVENDRVIGGVNNESTQRARAFYSKHVKGELHGTNARTAEMCKLVENSSRDVQIAFANELSIIAAKENINVWELIELANKHPRVNILQPGCGVGGHCIAVDPYFISSQHPEEAKLIAGARQVNNAKAAYVESRIVEEIDRFKNQNSTLPRVALLGLSFKPDIDDLRESPALNIARNILKKELCEIHVSEPNLEGHADLELTDYFRAIKRSDIVVFLVRHTVFMDQSISHHLRDKIVLDFCGAIDGR